MDNAPPLNLSTSIKIEESKETKVEIIEQLNSEERKDGENYMLFQYGLNNLENVITITGEPVTDNSKDDGVDDQHQLPDQHTKTDLRLSCVNEEVGATNTLYHCSTCTKVFVRANQLRQHEKVHMTTKDIRCHIGLKEYERAEDISQDIAFDDNINMSQVEQPKRMVSKVKDEEKKFKCPKCEMCFLREVYLTTHMRKHTGEKPFQCDICETRFKQMSHLTTHMRTHTQDRPFSCSLCNASFSQTGSLRRHFRSHTGEKPFKCDVCNAVFVEKRNLSRHQLSHTGERPYKCDICPSSFTQLIDLQRHKLSHFGIKPFKCEVCMASFSRKNHLRWHEATHEGETPYMCDICEVGFRKARDLKTHKRSHSDYTTFNCDKCDTNFSQLSSLKRHMIIHNTNKSLLCNKCGETCKNAQALLQHIKQHGNEKKFACDQCLMTFTHMKPLKAHKLAMHCEVKPEKVNNNKMSSNTIENFMNEDEEEIGNVSQQILTTEVNLQMDTTPKETLDLKSAKPMPYIIVNQPENVSNGDKSSQEPTLILTQPGLPSRSARLAGNCQNHTSHLETILEGMYQVQEWCFCDMANITRIPNTDITPNNMCISSDPIFTSCSSTHTPVSAVPSTSNNIQNQSEMLDHTSYPSSNGIFESDLIQYLHDKNSVVENNIPGKQILHSENPIKKLLPGIDDSPAIITKDNLKKSLQIKSGDIQNNLINENSLTDYTETNIPLNLRDSNNDLGGVKNAKNSPSLIEGSTKKEYFLNKNTNRDKYIISSDGNSMTDFQNIPSTTTSILDVIGEKKIQNGIYISESKEYIKNYLSPNLDDKTFMNNAFSSQFLSDDSSNKSVINDSHLPNNTEAISKELKKSYNNEELQAFENVFEEYASSNLCNDKNLPVEYCLTVNNPATGEIQIQSDVFSSKQHEITSPMKKRKLTSKFDKELKSNECNYCSKSFSKKSTLECHMRTHTGEKLMMCGVCNQCFSHKPSLIVHMRNHTGERPYKCYQCKASFTQKSNLRVHNRTHTGERPFTCNLCEASFTQGSHLKAHKRIHFNHRPFVCLTCNHAFTQKSALTRHEGKHANGKINICLICQATFSTKNLMRKHAASHKRKQSSIDRDSEANLDKIAITSQNNDTVSVINDSITAVANSASMSSTEKFTNDKSPNLENNGKDSDPENIVCNGKDRPATLQPTRRSRRILESASKKNVNRDSDFITGDLDEIDRAEQIENQLIAVKPRKYTKKPNNAEVVQSWCFCEVANGPNEPHTHITHDTNSTMQSIQDETSIQTNVTQNTGDPSTGTVYQLSIPNLSHTIVLQGNEAGGNTLAMSNDEIILPSDGIDHPGVALSGVQSSHFGENEFPTLSVNTEQRLLRREETGNLFGPAPVINQVFTANQLVNSEGNTVYTLQQEGLSTDTVVSISSAGAIFFDVSSDEQMLTLPMQDPIIVGSAGDIQNTMNLSESSANLQAITPVSLSLPIENLQQNTDDSIASPNATENVNFAGNNMTAGVNFVPLENNFIELLNEANENLDMESLKLSIPKNAKVKKPYSFVCLPSRCFLCAKEFVQKSSLHQHMKEEHSSSNYCRFCLSVFPSEGELTTHMLKHSQDTLCNECNIVFDNKAQLHRHRIQVHKMGKVKKDIINCIPCGVKFSQVSDFKRHMQSHLGIKPFICELCGSPFTRRSSLNKHERIHTGERPYKCTQCDKSFSYRYQFNAHKATQCGN